MNLEERRNYTMTILTIKELEGNRAQVVHIGASLNKVAFITDRQDAPEGFEWHTINMKLGEIIDNGIGPGTVMTITDTPTTKPVGRKGV